MSQIDLFSGTGSIAFELLSRGCKKVIAVEKDNTHAAFISKVARELKTESLHLICGDAFRFLNTAKPESFDFIFADPPYSLATLEQIPQLVLERDLLRPEGIFVMEHPKEFDFSLLPHFSQRRIYGSVNFSLFIKTEEKTNA